MLIHIIVFAMVLAILTLFSSETYKDQAVFGQNLTGAQNQTSTNYYEVHTDVEEMLGHLDASIENKQNNDVVLAIGHALHPVHEGLVDAIKAKLFQNNRMLSNELSLKIQDYITILGTAPITTIVDKKTELENMLNEELHKLISTEKINNKEHILNVTAQLINDAQEEYSEAVLEGKVINKVEFQDAQQFTKRAILLLDKIGDSLSAEEKQLLVKLNDIKNMIDLKGETSKVSSDVKDIECKIMGGYFC